MVPCLTRLEQVFYTGVVRIRKLPQAEARRLFPEPEAPPPPSASRECAPSPTGRHSPLDLSGLRYRPTPPFCAWCGHPLPAAGSASPSARR
jgi:hypothetical protein